MIDNFKDITNQIRRLDNEIEDLVLKSTTNVSASKNNVTCEFNDRVQEAINVLLELKHKYVNLCSLYQ